MTQPGEKILHKGRAVGPSTNLRECRIDGCTTVHRRNLFCCGAHWASLPKHLRDAIWRAYRNPGVFSDEYQQAAENAEAFLEDRDAQDVGTVFA